jgi:hypothetical protein
MKRVSLIEAEAEQILIAAGDPMLPDAVFAMIETIITNRLVAFTCVSDVRLARVRALAEKWEREGVPVRGCKNADADEALLALQEALR